MKTSDWAGAMAEVKILFPGATATRRLPSAELAMARQKPFVARGVQVTPASWEW